MYRTGKQDYKWGHFWTALKHMHYRIRFHLFFSPLFWFLFVFLKCFFWFLNIFYFCFLIFFCLLTIFPFFFIVLLRGHKYMYKKMRSHTWDEIIWIFWECRLFGDEDRRCCRLYKQYQEGLILFSQASSWSDCVYNRNVFQKAVYIRIVSTQKTIYDQKELEVDNPK